MTDLIDDAYTKEDYSSLFENIVGHIEQAKDNIKIIKEKGILDLYWNLGETLIEMDNISDQDLKDLTDNVNKQLQNDSLFRYETTNTHWLRLAMKWVKEHSNHDKQILLSGAVTWIQWALLLDIVSSAPQRYWLACQTIKQKWDAIALLRAAQSLPKEYLNL